MEGERQTRRDSETQKQREQQTGRHTEAGEAVPASWPRVDPGEARSLECHTANRRRRSSRQEAETTLWGDLAAGSGQREDSCPGRDARLCFMRAKHGLAKLTAHQVATALDLSRFSSACHLGGCTGALAHKLAWEYPRLKVTVFDLPEVIEHVTCFQPSGPQTEQVSFVPGDFFKDSLPEADLYVLSGILHDWPDEKVHRLLSRISGSCKPGGGLLVAEMALDEDPRAAQPGLLRSLSRLLQTQGGERSLTKSRQLLQLHGFTDVQVARMGDVLHVVLATRPAT